MSFVVFGIFLSIALQSVKMADPVLDLCEPTCYMYLYTVYRVAKGLEAFEAGSSEGVLHHITGVIHFMCCESKFMKGSFMTCSQMPEK